MLTSLNTWIQLGMLAEYVFPKMARCQAQTSELLEDLFLIQHLNSDGTQVPTVQTSFVCSSNYNHNLICMREYVYQCNLQIYNTVV